MNRKRFIYFTDLVLIPLFTLSLYTGIELHVAGHGSDHGIWHNWAVFHTITSLLFSLLGMIHVKSHWAWYKGLKTAGCRGKRKVVLILSVVFVSIIITGILLLFWVAGANSPIGLLHYKIGIVMGVLGVLHLLKRRRYLYNGFIANLIGNFVFRDENSNGKLHSTSK